MANEKFYIVAADALPEVFMRVAEARRMLQVGEADTVGEAACKAGISRSAFYKYKDAVQPFQNMKSGRIITFYTLLKDTPGVLSNILSIFANSGANILTINQTTALPFFVDFSDFKMKPVVTTNALPLDHYADHSLYVN